MADTKTFPCTEEQLATLAGDLAQHGVTIDLSHAGEACESGWDIAWVFPDTAHVSITVKKHPFAEEGFFWSKLEGIFGAKGA